MNRPPWGNPVLVTTQINAETVEAAETPAPAEAAWDTASSDALADGPSDAWDRLAALAFDGATAHGGCSAQAHECTCRAEHAGHGAHSGDTAAPSGAVAPDESAG
ncbi:hypothetical protein KDL01_36180 [Actinospica durhamensis]|uniref:Uncharacterized protein n=1 Tax=Actinospica durhamensis TaxID=1508375 RepID=A0A941EWU2_9ACTN|nr:hypothetical protein [Actinospica durhamensis]MBR7838763.1 hypothetical protein [Actinospica durhamensis]